MKTAKMKVLQKKKKKLINIVYFDMQISNPMSIFVARKEFFGLSRVSKLTFALQLLINSKVLLPLAAKRVELIHFSRPKSADCKKRGANKRPYLIFSINRNNLFFGIRYPGFPVTADEIGHRN